MKTYMVRKKQKAVKEESQCSVRCSSHIICRSIPVQEKLFFFYSDVEEEIEYTTVAKLEGCITMKIRPIHNSVRKGSTEQ